MPAVRVSEKEAIARGWINAPPPRQQVVRQYRGRPRLTSFEVTHAIAVIIGFLGGFVLALMFMGK